MLFEIFTVSLTLRSLICTPGTCYCRRYSSGASVAPSAWWPCQSITASSTSKCIIAFRLLPPGSRSSFPQCDLQEHIRRRITCRRSFRRWIRACCRQTACRSTSLRIHRTTPPVMYCTTAGEPCRPV
ncbi:hypothetical protein BU26DRAFT_150822 [Trematosphaeria pertusa]|uniref:Secreted protein n=1 Tax=Trematosphaeria pertusa TaxID=390896 RepID=A0A6A6IXR0_9PLEO|nr:uncharacterized protein BU26DRAFT_150822 [Trematosphaeria pertusa]KAF2255098.1 hypothetical protein BU26DRAFT_150822 [Trematosphaeria pertusa]